MNKIYPLSGFAMFFGCFTLYAQVPPPTPEICVVTTNDTINKHVIVWEKTPGDNIAFYKMFRENSLGGFDVLDTV